MADRTAFRSTLGLTAALLLIAGLVLVVQDPGRLRALTDFSGASEATGAGDGSGGGSGEGQPVGGSPSLGSPSPTSVPEVDPARPFAGSPAEAWPDGIAGLTLPPAKATGAFSAAEVAGALKQARRYVVAKRLDPAVLGGAQPSAFLALLDPKSQVRQELARDLRTPTVQGNPSYAVTRFDTRDTRLHGRVIKLKGTASVSAPERDRLAVRLDYTVVYAVQKTGTAPPEVTRLLVREEAELSTYRQHEVTPGTIWVSEWTAEFANAYCDSPDGFLHPMYLSDTDHPGPDPEGTPDDPYDTSQSLTAEQEQCGRITRV